jgi:hypothetical protein
MLKRKVAAEEKELASAVKKLKTPLEQKVHKPAPEEEKKKRKKRKKRDPTQPKKPLTAFFVYLSRRTERLKAKNPHLKHKEIIALAGRTFKELKPEARAVYEAAAKELAELYQKEFAEWKANQPEQPEQPEEANPGEDVASSDKRDGKRKRKKRDENKPKRPLTSFFVFLNAAMPRLKQAHPELKHAELISKAAQEWKEKSERRKQKYIDQAAALKAQYDKDIQAYNIAHPAEVVDADEDPQPAKKARFAKPERDPTKPKQPPSSYLLFLAHRREKLAGEVPTLGPKELLKAVGQEWRELSDKKRESYKKKADELREQYNSDIAAYREAHPELVTQKSNVKSEFQWPQPLPTKTARAQFIADMMKLSSEDYASEAEHRAALAEQWKSFSKKDQKLWQDKYLLAREAHKLRARRQLARVSDPELANIVEQQLRAKTGLKELPFRLSVTWNGPRDVAEPDMDEADEGEPDEGEADVAPAKMQRVPEVQTEEPDTSITWSAMKKTAGLLSLVEEPSAEQDPQARPSSRWCITSSHGRIYSFDHELSRKISKAYRIATADGNACEPLCNVASSIGTLLCDFTNMTVSPPFPALTLSKEKVYLLENGGVRQA